MFTMQMDQHCLQVKSSTTGLEVAQAVLENRVLPTTPQHQGYKAYAAGVLNIRKQVPCECSLVCLCC